MNTIIPEDISYLNYLSDRNSGLVLQNSHEILQIPNTVPFLPTEPIFTQYVDGNSMWTIDGVPVYLNGPVFTGIGDQSGHLSLIQTHDVNKVNPLESVDYPLEIPDKGFLTSSGLFFPNEVLLQLNLQTATPEQNLVPEHIPDLEQIQEADQITELEQIPEAEQIPELEQIPEAEQISEPEQIPEPEQKPKPVKQISLEILSQYIFKKNEPILSITKQIKDAKEITSQLKKQKIQESIDDFIEIISVHKCKHCSALFERYEDIVNHLQKSCIKKVEKKLVVAKFQPKVQKMSSLLIKDENKQPLVKDIYLCGMCEHVGCETLENLKEHMLMSHNMTYNEEVENTSVQAVPNNQKGSNTELKTIVSKQSAQKKVKCILKGCDCRFSRAELMMRHYECHVEGEPKKFKCLECDKTFFIWRVCSAHLWKCHKIDIGLYNCTVCNSFKCLSARNLLVHMSIHDANKPFKPFLCSICGANFKQMAHLKNHESVHKDIELLESVTKVKCTVCSKLFSSSKILKKHVQSVHNKFKPFICIICGHKCARKAMLELHFRQHTGEKPFKCKICDYKTGDHNSLRRHTNRHFGITNYSCPHCNYTTIQSIAYKSHIKKNHPGKKGFYSCLACSFDTVNEQIYKDHLKEHSVSLTNGGSIQIEVLNENVTSSSSSNKKTVPHVEDEETQPGFFSDHLEDMTVDTGGITIPAGLEMQD